MKIALVGNPNAGKSSVFNQLTGLRQRTGNFPGVTVDKKTGRTTLPDGETADVIDLPGAYSLYPNSMDERMAVNILCDRANPMFPDVVIYIADVNNLERHLLLCSQIIDLGMPVVIGLTMTDIAGSNEIHCNVEALSKSLDGIPVVKINGRTGSGLDELLKALPGEISRKKSIFLNVKEFAPEVIHSIEKLFQENGKVNERGNDYRHLLIAHHHKSFGYLSARQIEDILQITDKNGFDSIRLQVQETLARYEKISRFPENVMIRTQTLNENSKTEKIDRLITHKIFGSLIFLGILFLIFQAIFEWAVYPMEWIDATFSQFSLFVKQHLPEGIFSNLLAEGVIPGLAGVCIFIPQIAILFTFIVILEDMGYMSRAIFLSDNLMRKFGLNGRSMVSLFSGLACAVPAIMSTRTINNWKERLITIMVTPLVSCSARIPVFIILVALVVPADSRIGIFNAQGVTMMGLYLLGITAALASAFVMKMVIKTEDQSYLVMELPSYKSPHFKNIALTVWDKVKIFVTQAGKIIMVISIILWFLSSYGPKSKMEEAENTSSAEIQNLPEDELENFIATRKMEASYAGHLGRLIEPVIRPLGFDWKIGIALITSFAAREVFVGTMATLYSVGSNDEQTVMQRLKTEVNPNTKELVFTPPVAMSLLIFYVFAMQCMSTLAVVKRETKSWKWPVVQFIYMTALAYLGSLITYQLMR